MKYPNIMKLGLEIYTVPLGYQCPFSSVVGAMEVETILQSAPTVQGFKVGPWVMREQNQYDTIPRGCVDTHTAKLIMIEPIVEKEISITRAKLEKALKAIKIVRHDNEDLFKELGL